MTGTDREIRMRRIDRLFSSFSGTRSENAERDAHNARVDEKNAAKRAKKAAQKQARRFAR